MANQDGFKLFLLFVLNGYDCRFLYVYLMTKTIFDKKSKEEIYALAEYLYIIEFQFNEKSITYLTEIQQSFIKDTYESHSSGNAICPFSDVFIGYKFRLDSIIEGNGQLYTLCDSNERLTRLKELVTGLKKQYDELVAKFQMNFTKLETDVLPTLTTQSVEKAMHLYESRKIEISDCIKVDLSDPRLHQNKRPFLSCDNFNELKNESSRHQRIKLTIEETDDIPNIATFFLDGSRNEFPNVLLIESEPVLVSLRRYRSQNGRMGVAFIDTTDFQLLQKQISIKDIEQMSSKLINNEKFFRFYEMLSKTAQGEITMEMLHTAAKTAGIEIEVLFLLGVNNLRGENNNHSPTLGYVVLFPDDCRLFLLIPTTAGSYMSNKEVLIQTDYPRRIDTRKKL